MNENVVVSADWLADRLGEVAVVDVRDAWEYEGIGHVPGAVNIPFETFRSASSAESAESAESVEPRSADESSGPRPRDQGMLPGAKRWADLLGAAGIAADDTVVAYDDMHGVFAARFLVTAELYGPEDLHLLDGDFSSWTREHETTSEVPNVEPADYEVREPAHSPLVSREAVESAMNDPNAVLVDTRDPSEFAAGHIPGAVNLDWRELVDDDTRGLKPRDGLRSILDAHDVTPDRHVVLYCNTARRISHTYVVLSSLGYDDIAFYEGSLTEWEAVGGSIETES